MKTLYLLEINNKNTVIKKKSFKSTKTSQKHTKFNFN